MKKTYKVPVSWTVAATMNVEAESLDAALLEAEDLPLPTDGEYIDGSFEINHAMIEYFNENNIDIS